MQPLTVQATTVNSLFNDSLAALAALQTQWNRFTSEGISGAGIQEQFTRLLGGMLNTAVQVLDQALTEGTFPEFLNVLASIPQALTALNPELAKLQAIGATFGQVAGPNAQRIATLEDAIRSTAERASFMATRVIDLRGAIADAGLAADQALPLYAQLSEAVLANAELQIQVIKEMEQAWQQAMDQVQSDIDALEEGLGSLTDQVVRGIVDMRVAADEFNAAAASGDTLAAIEAIQVYEQALVAAAESADSARAGTAASLHRCAASHY